MDKILITNRTLYASRDIRAFVAHARKNGASKIYLRDMNLAQNVFLDIMNLAIMKGLSFL